jgi:predicted acyltransferase
LSDARSTLDPAPAPVRAAPSAVPIAEPPGRLLSLDAFRGITIAGMLLVNNPGTWGAIYPPLRHADWHGWTPTDLIFPFFLFIVGVAATFSFAKELERGRSRWHLFDRMTRRVLILFGLGLILHGFPDYDLGGIRIMGVLQRIAVAYFFASIVMLTLGIRGQAIVVAILLLGYWALMTLVPVPGIGAGVLEPGQDLGAYLDRTLLGTHHLWRFSGTWDPEGLLSTLPAIGTVLTGSLAGFWIRSGRGALDKTVGLFIAGNIGLVLGLIWHAAFPINKPIWTSSYVLFTSGFACHFLALCYWLIDVKGYRRWAHPFVIYGTNAIAAFFLSSLMARGMNLVRWETAAGETIALKTWLFQNFFLSWASPINASLAFALTYVLFWLGIMALFYRRGLFIKV